MARRRNKSEERDVAVRRIDSLLGQARIELLRAPAMAPVLPNRYGALALRVAEKFQTGLAPAQKTQVCRKCGAFRSATTSRTRIASGAIAIHCLACGHVARRPLQPKPAQSVHAVPS